MTKRQGSDESEGEARRILDRVAGEAGSDASLLARGAGRIRRHLGADDVDDTDWAELWGTRIGRLLGPLIMVALLVWLILHLTRG